MGPDVGLDEGGAALEDVVGDEVLEGEVLVVACAFPLWGALVWRVGWQLRETYLIETSVGVTDGDGEVAVGCLNEAWIAGSQAVAL